MGGTFDTDVKNEALRVAVRALPLSMSDGQGPVMCEVGFNGGASAVTVLEAPRGRTKKNGRK